MTNLKNTQIIERFLAMSYSTIYDNLDVYMMIPRRQNGNELFSYQKMLFYPCEDFILGYDTEPTLPPIDVISREV
jgi:hypothetical protein